MGIGAAIGVAGAVLVVLAWLNRRWKGVTKEVAVQIIERRLNHELEQQRGSKTGRREVLKGGPPTHE